MTCQRVHYLPVILVIICLINFIISYTIAVLKEDVEPLIPYISDTGTYVPQSCIFGQFLNVGALLEAVIAYIRYLQIQDIQRSNDIGDWVNRLNGLCLILGLIIAIGLSIVANFQVSNVFVVHVIGALMAFGGTGLYSFIQSYISFKLYPILGNKILNWLRLVLSVIIILFSILSGTFGSLAAVHRGKLTVTKWKRSESSWNEHFVSTLSEWLIGFCILVFFTSFFYEFKRISLEGIKVTTELKSSKN